MIRDITQKALSGKILTCDDVFEIIDSISKDKIAPEQISAILGAISARNSIQKDNNIDETSSEISYFIKALKKYSISPNLKSDKGFMDICGTGGDCLGTFNISTAVSFVVASLGAKIAKHGSRAVSSSCGSADVLEELGIKIDCDENLQNILDETNLVFLFAPKYNNIMSKIKKIRNSIGIPTIFNLLGPLINPIKLDYQVMGVYDFSKCEILAHTLYKTGLKRAFVIHAKEGLDELSTTSDNIIYEQNQGKIERFILPKLDELGLKKAKIDDIKGGDKKENAKIILDILSGKKGAKRDIVVLNAALALLCYGISPDIYDGVKSAQNALDCGLALNTLEKLRKCF